MLIGNISRSTPVLIGVYTETIGAGAETIREHISMTLD